MSDTVFSNPRERAYMDAAVSARVNQVSWGAIFAGVAVALVVQFLLNLLGVGIGLAVLEPLTPVESDAQTVSFIGGIWFILSSLFAAFVGGFIASRLSGRPSTSTGGYHGITTWAVTTLFIIYMLTTSIGALVGGTFTSLANVVGGAGRAAVAVAQEAAPALQAVDPFASIEAEIRQRTGISDPEALRNAAIAAMRAVVMGDLNTVEEAKNRAAEALARAENIPVDQARAQVQEFEQRYKTAMEDARKKAIDAAHMATTAISTTAILSFVTLFLGAIAGWLGGLAGTRKDAWREDL